VTDSGEVLVSYESQGRWAVVRLDRQNKRWQSVETGTGAPTMLWGTEGDQIVGRRGGLTETSSFSNLWNSGAVAAVDDLVP